MRDKILPCSTVRNLMAVEAEGLLSGDSVLLVREHLSYCADCRRARQDMGLQVGSEGKLIVPENYPPIPPIQRVLGFLGRFKLLSAALVVLLGLAIFWHNYNQPLVVEERSNYDSLDVFVITGTWEEVRQEQFNIKQYNYTSTIEDMVRTTDFSVKLGNGINRTRLTGDLVVQWLQDQETLGFSVNVVRPSETMLARTGWLVWHRSKYESVSCHLSLVYGVTDATGWGSTGVKIYEERDPDYALPLVMAGGKEKHSSLIPVGISRPGVKGE